MTEELVRQLFLDVLAFPQDYPDPHLQMRAAPRRPGGAKVCPSALVKLTTLPVLLFCPLPLLCIVPVD